jgi:hypothetical protein
MVKSSRMRLVEHGGDEKYTKTIWSIKSKERRQTGKPH